MQIKVRFELTGPEISEHFDVAPFIEATFDYQPSGEALVAVWNTFRDRFTRALSDEEEEVSEAFFIPNPDAVHGTY